MENIRELYMNLELGVIRSIYLELFRQVEDEVKNPGTYFKKNHDFKVKCLNEALDIYEEYCMVTEETTKIKNFLKN